LVDKQPNRFVLPWKTKIKDKIDLPLSQKISFQEYRMNKLTVLLMALVFGSTLFFTPQYTTAQDKSAKKILVVYYSRTGNT